MVAHNKGLLDLMKGGLRMIFPPHCLCCGETVSEEGGLCPSCWNEASFISGSACSRCGIPLPGDGVDDEEESGPLVCDECLHISHPWVRGRAAMVYEGTGRKLTLMLKHGDRLDIVPTLGDWVARAAAPLVRPDMLVIPVPVHIRRLLRRKYNQAALLADRVARVHSLEHLPYALRRLRHTPMQDHGSVRDRFANVEDAFGLERKYSSEIEGRAILLVDDVMTSGATLATAADVLRAAGSGPISVVVLARAVKDA
ncbi:ComF family protein [Paracoccus sp. MBLB3053]|uniref:ComF family protein n=1 Tax=Paracoccus aurantius TaxID=3073814 RepID=A0ABU2HQ11_9RHOB|nr:ComF family protein [Paracoccus sp. MBLB3053]MDS9466625.1 ComF family protein [Paracoccus sp. MBLB3053]